MTETSNNDAKEVVSLHSLNFNNHYIGLRWRQIQRGNSNRETDAKLNDVIKKLKLEQGVIVHTDECLSVGLCGCVKKDSYSAAAVAANSLSSDSPNAFVIEDLGDDKYWYLCIINKSPVPARDNDSIINGKEALIDKVFEYYRLWDMVGKKVIFVAPVDIQREIVSKLDDEQANVEIGYSDLFSALANPKSSKISKLSSTAKKTKLFDKGFLIIMGIISMPILLLAITDNSQTTNKNSNSIDSIVKSIKSTKPLISGPTDEDLRQLALEEELFLRAIKNEEAKWFFQTLSLSGPIRTLDTLTKYIDQLTLNVGGWFPYRVEYTAKTRIEDEEALSIDLTFDKTIVTTWRNGGGATVNDFKEAVHKNNIVEYKLDGSNLDVITRVLADYDKDEYGDYEDAVKWLSKTNDMHLNIISALQNFKKQNPKSNFAWNVTSKPISKRLKESKSAKHKGSGSIAKLQYTVIGIRLNMSGFGVGYPTLKKLKAIFENFPALIITNITVNLETEEIAVAANLLMNNSVKLR